MHSVAQFGGDPFCPVEYQERIIGFVGDRIMGIDPNAIIIKDEIWVWSPATVADKVIKLTTHFDNLANKGIMYVQQQGDTTKSVETPVLLLIPAGLVEWLLIAQCSLWDLHKKNHESNQQYRNCQCPREDEDEPRMMSQGMSNSK